MRGEYRLDVKTNSSEGLFSEEFFQSAVVQWSSIGSLFANLISWSALAYFIRPVDFPIILHYNVFFGVDMIGAWWQAYSIPLLGAVVLCINGTLGLLFFQQKERVVAHLLLLASFVVQMAVLVATAAIIVINY